MGETESRKKIIIAAVKLASGKRLDQIGPDALALHSGISEVEVTRIFPNCGALATGIFQWVTNSLMMQVEHAALRNIPLIEVLEDIFHIHVAFLVSHTALPPLFLEALSMSDGGTALRHQIGKLLKEYEAELTLLFHLAQRDEVIRPDLDAAVAAKLFICLIQGLAVQTITSGTTEALPHKGRAVWQQYLHGIRA